MALGKVPVTQYYRADAVLFSDGPVIHIHSYQVQKETKCGVWLWIGGGKRRFVKTEARKRFALPTSFEAVESLIARKKRQTSILKAQLKTAQAVLEMAQGEAEEMRKAQTK